MSDNCPASLMLANGALLVVSTIMLAQGDLLSDEAQLLVGTRAARRREIIAGRTMARYAMSVLGVAAEPILMDRHGGPRWPAGLCGSIAHSPQHIAVVISQLAKLRSLGIDIEDGRDLGAAAADVASEADIQATLALGLAPDAIAAVRIVFSAKEAVFKCLAPVTGNMRLDFGKVALVQRPEGTLCAKFAGLQCAEAMSLLNATTFYFKQLQGVTAVIAALR